MGIKDLYSVIKEHSPNQLVVTHFSNLSGYRIAIDISVFLYKFVRTAGPERWVDLFLMLMCMLKENSVRAVCIFDGPNFPVEKKSEQESRRASTAKIREKTKEITRILHKLQEEFVPYDLVVDESIKNEIQTILRIDPLEDATNYRDPVAVCEVLERAVDKYERQTIPITSEFAMTAKELMDILGVTYLQADGEAETLCAHLAITSQVDCVMTEDTDVLPYGTPIMLAKLDLAKSKVTVIQHRYLIKSLNMTSNQFRDMCICLGCDYNERAKAFPKKKNGKPVGVGAKKVFDFITTYGEIENFEEQLVDPSVLKYPRCRELFSTSKQIGEIVEVPFPRELDELKLLEFLREHKTTLTFEHIRAKWKKVDMVFS